MTDEQAQEACDTIQDMLTIVTGVFGVWIKLEVGPGIFEVLIAIDPELPNSDAIIQAQMDISIRYSQYKFTFRHIPADTQEIFYEAIKGMLMSEDPSGSSGGPAESVH